MALRAVCSGIEIQDYTLAPAQPPPAPPPPALPSLSPICFDSDAPYESATGRSQDSNYDHGAEDSELDDEIRTMFTNVRQKTKKAQNSIAQRHNSSPLVHTFNISDLVSLHIDAKYHKSKAPAELFCSVFRKPQPDMHELQRLHEILSRKYRTTDLERLPASIDLQIGNNTTRIALTKAVALIHEANPTAVWTPPSPGALYIPFQVVTT